jgi:hypothetical protein
MKLTSASFKFDRDRDGHAWSVIYKNPVGNHADGFKWQVDVIGAGRCFTSNTNFAPTGSGAMRLIKRMRDEIKNSKTAAK